ncbi:MAG: hypothetical protein KJ558_00765 [Gammaproteobacteria bacterium]|nr:hypothetical protein [Gammaproteobacteria bacterium]MBU1653367.1 hypothetical protein [Gammaproteobacteria bacterium]MBU1960522.1 hypothetical protein [Gammaproteobacteria bacterium]
MNQRTIGKRRQREIGPLAPPTPEERAWLASFAGRRTSVPKGIYRYRTHEEANADWDRWNAERVAETLANR